eukprot:TRINITY_DN10491_c0_g1_i1.p1 TRINITY_DN10491_c0_g1~~TRINITY_DN10491_c0_g1_i1.p1  ORF type:complete len:220 (+),score=32.94 TRINITY_DN10491_c0_g1_i1:42-701(+)
MLSIEQVRNVSGNYDAGRICHLVLRNQNLQNIATLIACKDITYLDISFNEIMDISALSRLVKLEHLIANDNKIRSFIPLKKLTQLVDLRVHNNEPSSIAAVVDQCKEMSKLKRLDLFAMTAESADTDVERQICSKLPSIEVLNGKRLRVGFYELCSSTAKVEPIVPVQSLDITPWTPPPKPQLSVHLGLFEERVKELKQDLTSAQACIHDSRPNYQEKS